jgi:hypothetical protein
VSRYQYQFTTTWRFEAPVERVWLDIKAMDLWPEWWRYVARVELVREGDANEIGAVRRITWKTALPYTLTFDSELVRETYLESMEGHASGELEGQGIWTFSTEGNDTVVRYAWRVNTTKWWMNLLAPLAGPLFAWNHDKVMEAGYEGLKARLAARH